MLKTDRRTDRTRRDLLAAFRDELLERGFERMTVSDVIARAGVGRSTFYEHYRNKDDILRESFAPIAAVLAGAVSESGPSPALVHVVAHLRENRRLTGTLLAATSREVIVSCLADLIEDRLPAQTTLPGSLLARFVAGAQFALVEAWLDEKPPSSPAVVAAALHASTVATVAALTRNVSLSRS